MSRDSRWDRVGQARGTGWDSGVGASPLGGTARWDTPPLPSSPGCRWDALAAGPATDRLSVSGAGFDHVGLAHVGFERGDASPSKFLVGIDEGVVLGGGGADAGQVIVCHASSMAANKALHNASCVAY